MTSKYKLVPVGRVKTVGGYPDETEHTIEWLCKYKDLKDGDLLYTATQPTPEVAKLVEALEEMIDVANRVDSWESFPSDPIERAEDAIRCYHKHEGKL